MIADLVTQHALDRYHDVGLDPLTEQEKTLATIWHFESAVANGGFERWFTSREGELAAEAPRAFRTVGAPKHASIAERANEVFGPAGVPRDWAVRRRTIESLPAEGCRRFEELEAEYADLAVDLDDRIEAYIAEGRDDAGHGASARS